MRRFPFAGNRDTSRGFATFAEHQKNSVAPKAKASILKALPLEYWAYISLLVSFLQLESPAGMEWNCCRMV